MKQTLVIGASVKPDRYAYKAIKKLLAHQHKVVAISNRAGQVDEVVFHTDLPKFEDIDTVTLYLNPMRQKDYYNYIVSLQPRRVIFNPGTENPELQEILRKNNIDFEEACTLVLLATNQY
ncbi:MAG TPA: CoA-binding protein [Flavobacterium sp.]|nr:CoA-binding protein [Flavobacterium sp.]